MLSIPYFLRGNPMNKTQKFFPKNVEKMYEKGNFNKFFDEVSIPKRVEAFKAEPLEDIIHEIDLLPIKEAPIETESAPEAIIDYGDTKILTEVDNSQYEPPIPQHTPIEREKSKKPLGLLVGIVLGVVAIGAGVWIYKQNKPTSEIVIPMIAEESKTEALPDLNAIHLPLQNAEVIAPPETEKEPESVLDKTDDIQENAVKDEDKQEINDTDRTVEPKEGKQEAEAPKNDEIEKNNITHDENQAIETAPVKALPKKAIKEPKPVKKIKKEPKKEVWELEADKKLQELNDALK